MIFIFSIVVVFIFSIACAEAKHLPDNRCLECHIKKDLAIRFDSGEEISGYVNPEDLKQSVHKNLTCQDCHRQIIPEKHTLKRYRSLEQFRRKMALNCRGCHREEMICKVPIHLRLKAREGVFTAICMNCHGAHNIKKTGGALIIEAEKRYCMNCHSREIEMVFYSGEKISLRVSLAELKKSVHSQLTCSDCHRWFSIQEHPERFFKSKRAYIIVKSEMCRRCHFDKYSKSLESIHHRAITQGKTEAPVCIDCHGGHDVVPVSKNKKVLVQKCKTCHQDIYETYSQSVHGRALIEIDIQDVPICIDCHRAHDIESPLTAEFHNRIPDICAGCHANTSLMRKYGLSTEVVKTYLSDFHGITLGFYKMQKESPYRPLRPIAVCTDCHGIHDIKSMKYEDPASIKKKLVQRCRKCHLNANENFPDTWLYHYEPSLKKTPCIYLVKVFYRFFIPFMLFGLFLQIVIHIWRYAVNR